MEKPEQPLLGTVYLIEQGISPQQQRRDLENIAKTGLKLVVLWPRLTGSLSLSSLWTG